MSPFTAISEGLNILDYTLGYRRRTFSAIPQVLVRVGCGEGVDLNCQIGPKNAGISQIFHSVTLRNSGTEPKS
jgi:hypothetical protein